MAGIFKAGHDLVIINDHIKPSLIHTFKTFSPLQINIIPVRPRSNMKVVNPVITCSSSLCHQALFPHLHSSTFPSLGRDFHQ